jgi:hypothetical protein
MVVAYKIGQAWQNRIRTIYQQHTRYMMWHDLLENPRDLFQANILASITRWIESGNRIILFINMNEHILTGNLPRELLRLGLQEATHKRWEDLEPCTFVYGNGKPINSVYHTPGLITIALMQLSFHQGVGDHRTVLVDISTDLAIGKFEKRVVPPKARRLVTKNENSMKAYVLFVTKECQRHRIQRNLDDITSNLRIKLASPMHCAILENVDVQRSNIQRGGECTCRKNCQAPTSLEPAY